MKLHVNNNITFIYYAISNKTLKETKILQPIMFDYI